jgi:hypothetical protein
LYPQSTYIADESQASFCGVTRELFDLEKRYRRAVRSPRSTDAVMRKAVLAQVAVELQIARHRHSERCEACLVGETIAGAFKDGADSNPVRRRLAITHV